MSVSAIASPAPYPASPSRDGGAARHASTAAAGAKTSTPLSPADQQSVDALKKRDQVVRTHERAHMSAGAGLITQGASYEYQTGPDGQRYAVGGEVSISMGPGRTPAETLAKAEQIRSAALAPADPSAQDQRVAAEASRMAMEARSEMATQSSPGDSASAYRAGGAPATGAQVDTYA